MLSPYYHLSFDGELTGEWQPRTPQGFAMVQDAKGHGDNMTEPRTPRICLSPSVEGCFYAIYPNIYSLFEVKKYPHANMYLYRAYIDDTDPLFKNNATLTKDRLVWDAHITKEVWYLGDLKMTLLQKVKLTPLQKKEIHTRPFLDEDRDMRFVAPEVKIDVVKRYPNFYSR